MKSRFEFIEAKWKSIKENGFIRSISVLVGGTAFAQLITVVSLPLLTRLYQPEDFSLLAVYTAALGIIAVVSCIRLDIAIPLPENDQDAASLLVLSLLSSAFISSGLCFAVLLWSSELSSLLRQPALEPYLWLLPMGVWLASSYSAVQFWTIRKKQFSLVARTRMVQALAGSGTQLGAGIASMGPGGLLFGQFILSGAGAFGLARTILKKDICFLRAVNLRSMRTQLLAYNRFPKYSMPEAFANTAAIHLPMIIIAGLALGPEAGYLFLAMRIMSAPMSLIGGAVAQVYLSHAPDRYRDGELGHFTSEIFGGLLKIGVGPLIFVGILSPVLFPIVFGSEWQRAGDLVAWMVPWMVLQFIASPISMSMHVRGWQKGMLTLTVFGLVLRVGLIFLAVILNENYLSEFYIASGAIFYSVCCFVFLVSAKVKFNAFCVKISESLIYIGLWVVLAIMLVALI